jgi:hypothetical protein
LILARCGGHEAYDFTPWLLANADALAEVLGINIELTAAEHPVGAFSLDLVGKDLSNGYVLMVENQLTATGEICWLQRADYMTAAGQDLMAAVTA